MQTRRSGSDDLLPLDSEIEATARRRGGRKRKKNQNKRDMGDPGNKSLLEYGIPDTTTGLLSSIVRPPVTA